MSVVDVLETEFNLKGNYAQKMNDVTAATQKFSSNFDKINRAQMMGGFARSAALAGLALVGVGAAISANAMQDSAQFDSLVKGLEAVEGSAEAARKKIEQLRELSKAPGIGFEQAVEGYGGLRRGGVDASLSASLVREAGNANAASGGGVAKFEQIMRAFGQIAAKPKLQGDELLQLNEAGLPIQKMLKEAFGTADTDALAKSGLTGVDVLEGLMRVMEKMPRVGGGFQNVLDNVSDALKRASTEVGNSLNAKLMPMLEGLGDEVARLADTGAFAHLGESMASLASTSVDAAGGVAGLVEKLDLAAVGVKNFGDFVGDLWDRLRKIPGSVPSGIDYLWGGDLNRAKGEAEAATKENQESAPFKRVMAWQAAAEAERAKKKAAEEESKKTTNPAQQILKKIEENTRALPEISRSMFGGGELARFGVTAHEIKGQRLSRKIARNIQHQAVGIAAQAPRLTQR